MSAAPVSVAHGPRFSGTTLVGVFIVACLAIGLGALAYLKVTPHPLAIGSILADLRKYDGVSVTVQGTVKDSVNIGGVKWYTLEDPTGSIMVVTQRGLPPQGQYEQVSGQVKQLFNIGGLKYTVLLEAQPPD